MKTKVLKKLCARLALAFTLSLGLTSVSSLTAYAASTFTNVTYNGREYKLYVPSGYTAGSELPLVVMLHGCTQDPDQFAAGTQMNQIAESENFLVMYPKQTTAQHLGKCWRFWEPTNQFRGAGEPALIAGMVDHVKSNYSINDDAVFVAGLSAGGAMTSIMGATYPDVFKAISVGSGLEYGVASTEDEAVIAMREGGPSPIDRGRKAYEAMGEYARVMPVMVFHGTSDSTVVTINGNQVLTQWAETNDLADDGISNDSIDDVADQTINGQVPVSQGKAYTRYIYNDANGSPIMEKYLVTGMGHAWSGGSTAGSYTDPYGPNQSQITWDFFQSFIPVIEIPGTIATPPGGTYPSPVTVTLECDDPTASIYYTTDGSVPTASSTIYTAPIVISVNTTLKFFSVNANGNVEPVKTETYNIQSGQISYETANGTAVDHYVAGRLDLNGYLAMGTKYGYVAKFNLYKVQGSTIWTDIQPK